jgi:hypothetical protein
MLMSIEPVNFDDKENINFTNNQGDGQDSVSACRQVYGWGMN